MQPFTVLYEDNHLLVVEKPAGLATMGAGDGQSVHRAACRYIADKYNKPGKVFLGVVHRLDSMASGVLVLARTSKAAARLSEQFRDSQHGPQKIYVAAVQGHLGENQGCWIDRVWKDESAHRMRVVDSAQGGVEARLQWRLLRRGMPAGQAAWSLVAVRLMTGRKHQIRVQFADRDHPIIGDRKYGGAVRPMRGIALQATSLTIKHPTKGNLMTFRAGLPDWQQSTPTVAELDQIATADDWLL